MDPWKGEICTVSLSAAAHESRVVPISHKVGQVFEPSMDRDEARKLVLDLLDEYLFKNEKVLKIAVNLSFETKYAAKYGKYILGKVADPLIMWVRCLQIADLKRLITRKTYKRMGFKTSYETHFWCNDERLFSPFKEIQG